MGKMLDKYKNVSSLDFKEEELPLCPKSNREKKDNKDNNINSKFNSLREQWFCYWMNRRIAYLKKKVLSSKKIEA